MADKSKRLNVKHISIQNVLGARDVKIDPGQITLIKGPNAAGKTSTIEALKVGLGRGNLAKIQTIGAEEPPEVVLVLEPQGGGNEYNVRKTARTHKVQVDNGEDVLQISRPLDWLSGLYDGKYTNPITFMQASEKDRAVMLVEALPDVEFDESKLWEMMGLNQDEFDGAIGASHPLQRIAEINGAVFKRRTDVNRELKIKSDSADQMFKAIPDDVPEDIEKQIHAINDQIDQMIEAVSDRENEILEQKRTAIDAVDAEIERQCAQSDDRVSSEVSGLEEQIRNLQEQVAIAQAKAHQEKDQIRSQAPEKYAKIEADAEADFAGCQAQRSEIDIKRSERKNLEQKQEEVGRTRALREQAEKMSGEANALDDKSKALTAALEALREYREKLAKEIPIEGLSLNGSTIQVDGIPWDNLNTAKQISVAVQVACLRQRDKRLPLVWIDGAEALDSKNLYALCDELKRQDVQAVIGKVTDDAEMVVENLTD